MKQAKWLSAILWLFWFNSNALEAPDSWLRDPETPSSIFDTFVLQDSIDAPLASTLQMTYFPKNTGSMQKLWQLEANSKQASFDQSLLPLKCIHMTAAGQTSQQTWCELPNKFLIIVESGPKHMRENSRAKLIGEKAKEIQALP